MGHPNFCTSFNRMTTLLFVLGLGFITCCCDLGSTSDLGAAEWSRDCKGCYRPWRNGSDPGCYVASIFCLPLSFFSVISRHEGLHWPRWWWILPISSCTKTIQEYRKSSKSWSLDCFGKAGNQSWHVANHVAACFWRDLTHQGGNFQQSWWCKVIIATAGVNLMKMPKTCTK